MVYCTSMGREKNRSYRSCDYTAGAPRLARPPRPWSCLDFGLQYAIKVQRANLTCDVIKKLAPFGLSKL